MRFLLIGLIRFYQYTISPPIGPRCRFYPSYSHYTLEAIHVHGALRDGYLDARWPLRYHPWRPDGYDPVPEHQEQVCACHGTVKPGE